jgi:hypothetical protein
MKVQNFKGNNGPVKNQFLIWEDDGTRIFQSYNSIIAKILPNGKTILGKDWDYSVTTGKYRNLFLGETKKETLVKIESGEYTIDNTL